MTNPQLSALQEAATLIGSQTQIARSLGVAPPTVNQWFQGNRPVPPGCATDLEWLTLGRVPVERLCPGVRWVRIPGADWPHCGGRPCVDVARYVPPSVGARRKTKEAA